MQRRSRMRVVTRLHATLIGYYRAPPTFTRTRLGERGFRVAALHYVAVVPLRKRLSSALIRSISLAPTSLAAPGLNCASGKVFPPLSPPFSLLSPLRFASSS